MSQNTKKQNTIPHKKTRKRKGGIHIIPQFTPSTAFTHFINNSSFSIFSTSGTTSVIILARLKEGVVTPYKTVRSNEFNNPVKTILIKLCASRIDKEVSIQKDIYKKSFTNEMSLLEPICPSVIFSYSEKLKKPLKHDFHKLILNSLEDKSQSSSIDRIFESDVYVIAMELMENYKPLSSFEGTPSKYQKRSSIFNRFSLFQKQKCLVKMYNASVK